MKKSVTNVVLTCIMLVATISIFGTIYFAKNDLSSNGNSSNEMNFSDDFGGMPSDGEMPSGEMPSGSDGEMPSGGMPSGDMADGGFAGAGDTSFTAATSTQSLTIMYIIIIGVESLVFASSFVYLIMSNFNKKKAFDSTRKIAIYALSTAIATTAITAASTVITNKYILNSNTGSSNSTEESNVTYTSTEDLNVDMDLWNYDEDNDVYWQIGVVYTSNPETVEYESLGIYVPGAYMDGVENEDGYYICTINTSNQVGNYTAETAPIVMPVNTAGYSAQAAPTSYSYSGLGDYLEAGCIYVYAGCRGRSTGEDYSGGAPWGVTDLKAAVRYIRYNDSELPGDTDSIFAFGHSGGGAQSTLLGSTGDSDLYTPYLESIGALMYDDDGNEISDAIAGVMAWCPITSLDYANEAYEWNMGQYSTSGSRSETTWTKALSNDLAGAYAEYINNLGLVDEDGNTLTLTNTEDGIYTSGSYYDYLLSIIEESLNNYLIDNYTSTSDMQAYIDSLNSSEEWIVFDSSSQSVTISSIEAFVNNCKSASKDVGAFDDLNRSQAENDLFGNDDSDYLHWDSIMANLLVEHAEEYAEYSDYDSSYINEYLTDLDATDVLGNDTTYRQNMYNPMYYLSDAYEGYETSTVATYWRIRTGITQGDTASTVEVNLALALSQYSSVESVDFATVWNQGHTTAERTGDSTTNFIEWINECLGY